MATRAVTNQIKAIKMDRVAISFTPRHVAYETETNKVFVSGELKNRVEWRLKPVRTKRQGRVE